MTKKLSDEEMSELQKLLTNRSRTATYIALAGAAAALVSSLGTAVASIIIALKTKGN